MTRKPPQVFRLDPLAARRLTAETAINDHFNRMAVTSAHVDAAHRRKRADALRVAAGEKVAEVSFAAEASRAGLTLKMFAARILAKPDDLAAREDARRKLLEAVRSAGSTAALAEVLGTAGLALAES